ncbi:MAG TPA: DEAD/DEAH box helicase, partial [Candidatus Lustribacter sp.]
VRTLGGFAALGLDERLIAALASLGYEEPTAIQREAIPPLLEGKDVLGQAATGTGKTAAFALPLLQRLGEPVPGDRAVRGLILVPTRELAMQVAEAVHKYARGSGVRVVPIYGGQSIAQQLRALERGVDVVVATPGRALDHLRRGSLHLDAVQTLILDEADEMLDMGFAEELEAILERTPTERQTALFSATLPRRILEIAKRHLHTPVHVKIQPEKLAAGATARVREIAYIVQRRNKPAALARVLDMEGPTSTIVFCRTRIEVDELTETLGSRGYSAEALHGGLSQEQRDRVLRRFRDGASEILVATDVAARGLDIEHVSHVVNFDVPSSPDAYLHRVGRTGRAGRDGVAVTLAEARESRLLRNIEQFTKHKISIESVPTAHDLRARRLELMHTALEETLAGGSLDAYRRVIEALAVEHDLIDVAAAAAKLADEARDGSADDEQDIPKDVVYGQPYEERPHFTKAHPDAAKRMASADMTRIFIDLGRNAGIRPADLVGAITNEAKVDARQIGAIDIADGFSLVEVSNTAVDDIIAALRGTKLRGKAVTARRDRKVKGVR